MGNLIFLFAAYTVIWLAVLLYSFSLGLRQKSVAGEIESLKALLAEMQTETPYR